jgi:hypothetical protein
MSSEGVNVLIQDSIVDFTRMYSFYIGFSYDECPYYQMEGIGGNFVMDGVTITGRNVGGTARIIMIQLPYNITMQNSQFIDTTWGLDHQGFITGTTTISC